MNTVGFTRLCVTFVAALVTVLNSTVTLAEQVVVPFSVEVKDADGTDADVITGSFTYDTDSTPAIPPGFYPDAITSASVTVDGITYEFDLDAVHDITVTDDSEGDSIQVGVFDDSGCLLAFELLDPNEEVLDSSNLPGAWPDVSLFEESFFIFECGEVFVEGCLIPAEGDTTPPEVACQINRDSLWPPNHKFIDVGLQAEVLDDQDVEPQVEVYVYSDEPEEDATGDGNHEPDATNVGPNSLSLRAERKGDSDGRVYLIVIVARDSAGNETVECCTVTVPHDRRKKSIASVEAQAEAAQLECLITGQAPADFYLIGVGPGEL